jgi:hypothetical protein
MADPVELWGTSHVFERHAIEAHLAQARTDPFTQVVPRDFALAPSQPLRAAIDAWLLARTRAAERAGFRLAVALDTLQPLERGPGVAAYRGTWDGLPVTACFVAVSACAVGPVMLAAAGRQPHVVKFFGVVPADAAAAAAAAAALPLPLQQPAEPQVLLVTELAPLGSLDGAVAAAADRGSPLPPAVLCEAARQIAAGMQELGSCGVVHRDLAARNVMAWRLGAGDVLVKLAGHGLLRDGARYAPGHPAHGSRRRPAAAAGMITVRGMRGRGRRGAPR